MATLSFTRENLNHLIVIYFALTFAAESISIDSETYLFGKLKKDYSDEFPQLIHRCNFNRRKKALASAKIELKTPMRSNQQNKEHLEPFFKRVRKRIETLFAQLCDQFMLKRNYAKSLAGLSLRILNKVAAVTCLQFINKQNNKPLNHLKYALAF